MQLNEMVVMVTGAASGMGRQFALSLARDGAKVFATDLNEEGLASLSEAAKDLAGEVATGVGNVAKESDVIGMVNGCIEAFGTINGLINNAGIFRDGLLVKKDRETGKVKRMTLDQWQTVIDVDLTGPFLCTEVAAAMIENNVSAGVIVNMALWPGGSGADQLQRGKSWADCRYQAVGPGTGSLRNPRWGCSTRICGHTHSPGNASRGAGEHAQGRSTATRCGP